MLLLAAEDARARFLASGDIEVVAELAFEWLGFKPSSANRVLTLQAVVDVVLSDEWRAACPLLPAAPGRRVVTLVRQLRVWHVEALERLALRS